MIQHIDEIKTQLQIALLANPGDTIVFQHVGIRLKHSRIAVDVARFVAFRARSRNREISRREQSIDIGGTGVRPSKVPGGSIGNIPVVAVQVVIAGVDRSIRWIGVVDPEGRARLDSYDSGGFPA